MQDVHEGGPAATAGLQSGDILKAMNGKPVLPPDPPMLAMGAEWSLDINRATRDMSVRVNVPSPRSRKQPYCEPRAVSVSKLDGNIGYLKVAIFPGLLGLDVARELDRAVNELSSCDRLIIDLRGH